MSREHIISASQFDEDNITIEGLPWCREPKTIGLKGLVAKNLCVNHNGALSPSDKEAMKFKNALKIMSGQPTLALRESFDARAIERWLLKTTINIALQGAGSGLHVNDDLVRIAFGQAVPGVGEGWFGMAEPGEEIGYRNGFRFESMTRKSDEKMVVAALVFHRFRMLYAFPGAPAVRGALRLRRMEKAPHWLKFRWKPELAIGDAGMQGARLETA